MGYKRKKKTLKITKKNNTSLVVEHGTWKNKNQKGISLIFWAL